jgi:uncharacterized membrane-anchored protein
MVKQQLVQAPTPVSGIQPAVRAITPLNTSEINAVVDGSIDSVREEVDDAFADMKEFLNQEPDEIMRICSGHSARLSEIRVRVFRIEDVRREWKNVRIRELEPTLEELERQYSIASRLHSVRELDFKISGGQV